MELLSESRWLDSPESRWLYLGLLALVVLERLGELILTRRNLQRAQARGGVEYGAGHYPWMVCLHTLFLIAAPAEVFLLDRPLWPPLAAVALVVVVLSMGLRYWAVSTLGDRWTTRVVCVPGEPAVNHGPYRWLRHPNYLAVVLEIAALPLVHGAWLTAVVFSLLNGFLLRARIRVEEQALGEHCAYERRLGDRPRLIPGR